ncbi:hypothetical protein D3C71_1472460 [compost metagenome]
MRCIDDSSLPTSSRREVSMRRSSLPTETSSATRTASSSGTMIARMIAQASRAARIRASASTPNTVSSERVCACLDSAVCLASCVWLYCESCLRWLNRSRRSMRDSSLEIAVAVTKSSAAMAAAMRSFAAKYAARSSLTLL